MAPIPSARQTPPCAKRICPSVRERSKNFPSMRGALQSLRSLAQSQTQAASRFVGSTSLGFHCCHPHEKTDPRLSSPATCFAESASHLTTWYQAEAGCNLLRPPPPIWLRKLSTMPSRFAGMPIDVKSATAPRYRCRRKRLPRIGPSGQMIVAGG
jgi:hypothetical protein